MEETIRCPMCSRQNPADQEVCQYCNARLKPLTAGTPPAETPAAESDAPSGELPDWLSSFREDEPSREETPAAEDDYEAEESSDEEVPEWLARIRERNRQDETPEEAAFAEPELPDWLQNEEPQSAPFEESDEEKVSTGSLTSDGSLNWYEESQDYSNTPKNEEPEDISIDAWLENLPDEPDRRSSTPFSSDSFPLSVEPEASESSSEWWNDFSEAASTPEAPSGGGAVFDYDSPVSAGENSWFAAGPFSTDTQTGDTDAAQPADQFPDWLKDIPNASAQPNLSGGWQEFEEDLNLPEAPEPVQPFSVSAADTEEPTAEEPVEDFPDLSQAFSGPAAPAQGDTPNWLSALDQAQESSASMGESPTQRAQIYRPETPGEFGGPAPDWLASLGGGNAGAVMPPSSIPFMNDEPQIPVNDLSADPFVMSSDLPDWLSALGPARGDNEQVARSGSGPVEFGADDLAPADLPSWVKAMRPIESVTNEPSVPQEVDRRSEKSGPLAGLQGVLPVEPSVVEYRKPPLYSVKLRSSDSQMRYAQVLEGLLSNETAPLPARPESVISSQRIFRIILGLLLVVAVIVSSIISIFPAPTVAGSEVSSFKASLDGITGDTPILVVVDYEPALAGEIEAAASGSLALLMDKGTPMVLVTSSPSGKAMAAHLISVVAAQSTNGAAYLNGEKIAQIGYLSGGPAGIYNFLNSPATTAPTWSIDSPILSGISSIKDFQRVVLLTDTMDIGQDWLEQWTASEMSLPEISQVPLLLITSAQAAPMLRPYYESQQIDGMMAGVQDGVVLEQLAQKSAVATGEWNGYTGGMIAATLIILIGGLGNTLYSRFNQKKSKDEV